MKIIVTAIVLALTTTAAMAGEYVRVNPDGTSYRLRTIGPVTYNEPTHEYGTGNGLNFVALPSPTNGTNGSNGQDGNDGKDGENGTNGSNGTDGQDGEDGTNGVDGSTGAAGVDGTDGSDGSNAVAPLGSLSFAAASSSFYGDGIGFGLSASTYSDIEGSIVIGFDLGNNWRAVAGITTDFNKRTAGSVGVGFSF